MSSPALLTRVAKIQKDIPSDKSFPSGDNEVVEKPNMLSVELSSRSSDDYIERLTELCENNHDDNLKEMLRKFLRVFYFEIGILEVACSKDAPEGFVENLVNNLKNWTGKNWEIRFALGQCYDNFRIGADIQAVRAIFPNAQVVSIRTFSNS